MSDDLPFEIQVDIIKRLPVKSLIQFRSVGKSWKSLIDSYDFIAGYSGQQQHLLVSYEEDSVASYERKYVSIVDDETFPLLKVSPTLPLLVKHLKLAIVTGSSHGLFCLYGYNRVARSGTFPRTRMAVIWNISIRKAVSVVVHNMGEGIYRSVLGFGVSRETTDPKIVKITYIDSWRHVERISCIPWQVEVFTLSTGAWRAPYSTNLPRKTIRFDMCSVVVDGFLYWLATHRDGEFSYHNLIVSFDMTSEEFREINLPDSLAHHRENLYISQLRKSLVVLERDEEEIVFVVWMMEDGVSKSFTKLFNIYTPDATIRLVLEFRKNGEPVIEVEHGPHDCSSLVVYEPYSKHINNLEINGTRPFYVYAYMETLLLLDQPDFILYNKGKH